MMSAKNSKTYLSSSKVSISRPIIDEIWHFATVDRVANVMRPYPVLLEDFPAPQLRAYPKYTVAAEKFHTVCLLGLANTRMKDYFDLWVLLDDPTLELTEVRRAIEATFERRKMPMPTTVLVGFTDAFAGDVTKQTQWKAFLKKNQLDPIALADVVNKLRGRFHDVGVI